MKKGFMFQSAVGIGLLLSGMVMEAGAGLVKTPSGPGWNVELAKGAGAVEFVAVGRPSALRIRGKGEKVQGRFAVAGNQVSGQAKFELDSLDTGIGTRDKHMKEKYLEVAKFPEATLQISKMTLPKDASTGDFKFEGVAFSGLLTLHGQTKPVFGIATVARAGSQVIVQAEFGLKITDYSIDIPSFAGITMADEVQVNVHAESPMVLSARSQ